MALVRVIIDELPKLKDHVVELIGKGASVKDACLQVNRSVKTYENWRADDKEFATRIDQARGHHKRAKATGSDPEVYNLTFAQWRKRYLKRDTYRHQQLWIDVLEGKEPDLWHDGIIYKKASPNRVLINCPPHHSKSTTITQEYATYRLCMNPAMRIVIISKTQEFAATFLHSIKTMLTDPEYLDLQLAYGPADGFKPQRGEGRWANSLIYLADRNLDASDKAAKDPSVVALGIGAAVYGRRADLIILDDAIDDQNAHAYEKQFDWLTRTILSRNKTGIVLVVGTRVASTDLYSHLLNDDIYITGKSPWTVLKTPAVLEYAEDPKDWVTLWPKSSQPLDENLDIEPDENGEYPAWDGPSCASARADNRPMIWALVWQQQETSDDMTFTTLAVRGCVEGRRKAGPLRAGAWGHPKFGAEGMTIIGSIDPAGTGEAFMMVYALDRATKDRYVLNAWMGNETTPRWYAEKIEEISPAYGVQEWVIEAQGYSNWLYHDERITRYCQARGIKIVPSYTGRNKIDPDFGVASMQPLFGSLSEETPGGKLKHNKDNLVHLPDPDSSKGVKAMIDQLITWIPGIRASKLRQDGPMALWFAETRARMFVSNGDRPASTHTKNRYLSRRAMRRQYVVSTQQQ